MGVDKIACSPKKCFFVSTYLTILLFSFSCVVFKHFTLCYYSDCLFRYHTVSFNSTEFFVQKHGFRYRNTKYKGCIITQNPRTDYRFPVFFALFPLPILLGRHIFISFKQAVKIIQIVIADTLCYIRNAFVGICQEYG